METFKEVATGIKLLKTPFCGEWSGVVLLKGNKNILIDSGASGEVVDSVIVPALEREGLVPGDISLLLCTHTHGDHIGGHFRFREISAAKIGAFEGSLDKLRSPLKYNIKIRQAFPKYSPPPSDGLKGVEPDFLVGDGEIIANRLKLVHTAGHDDDCVCWLDIQTGTLITGDSLQANGTTLQGLGFYQDLQAYRNSIKKLLELGPENLVPGHRYLPLDEVAFGAGNVKNYLESCLYLTDTYTIMLKEFLHKGISELPELAIYLIKHLGGRVPDFLFLPLYTVSQHLKEIKDAQPSFNS